MSGQVKRVQIGSAKHGTATHLRSSHHMSRVRRGDQVFAFDLCHDSGKYIVRSSCLSIFLTLSPPAQIYFLSFLPYLFYCVMSTLRKEGMRKGTVVPGLPPESTAVVCLSVCLSTPFLLLFSRPLPLSLSLSPSLLPSATCFPLTLL